MADLRERVQAEFDNINQALAALPPAETLPTLSLLELAGVAALLHSFYNGVENILKQIRLSQPQPVPTGEAWHKELVEHACAAAVISEQTSHGLREYLAFRHFFSHAYASTLIPHGWSRS